jgi:hypothetical protein
MRQLKYVLYELFICAVIGALIGFVCWGITKSEWSVLIAIGSATSVLCWLDLRPPIDVSKYGK